MNANVTGDIQEAESAVELLRSLGVNSICLSTNSSTSLSFLSFCNETSIHPIPLEPEEKSWGSREWFYFYNTVGVMLNLLFVAITAGLYLGLLTMDVLDLQILERTSNDENERKYARELIPIVKERHLLLVTILLVTTIAYEALPVFLEVLVPSWVAVLLSSTLILLFGEIIPTAIFTGPDQLYLGYTMSPLVKFFLWALYPIAKPIARLLDRITADEGDSGSGEAYNRGELSALVRIQYEERMKQSAQSNMRHPTVKEVIKYQRNKDRQWNSLKAEIMEKVNTMYEEKEDHDSTHGDETSAGGGAAMDQLVPPLHPTEINMVEGALTLGTKLAMDVYTPLAHVSSQPLNLILDKNNVTAMYSNGFSRVPVYVPNPDDEDDKTAYLGFLTTRHLMMIDWQDERELRSLFLQRPTCISPRTNLIEVLKILQNNGPQMSFVCARPDLANKALEAEEPLPVEAGLMGIITLVDIMESILQDRIYDEQDTRERDRAVATLTRWAATKLQSFMRKKTNEIKTKRRFSAGAGLSKPAHQTGDQSPSGSVGNISSMDNAGGTSTINETTPLLSLFSPMNNGTLDGHDLV